MRSLSKNLERVIPFSSRMQRGKASYQTLATLMKRRGFDKLLIIESRKGNPGALLFLKPSEKGLERVARIPILGITLQDRERRFTASSLKVEVDEMLRDKPGIRDLKNLLEEFLGSGPYEDLEGESCLLRITKGRKEGILLQFVDASTDRIVHPTIRIPEPKAEE